MPETTTNHNMSFNYGEHLKEIAHHVQNVATETVEAVEDAGNTLRQEAATKLFSELSNRLIETIGLDQEHKLKEYIDQRRDTLAANIDSTISEDFNDFMKVAGEAMKKSSSPEQCQNEIEKIILDLKIELLEKQQELLELGLTAAEQTTDFRYIKLSLLIKNTQKDVALAEQALKQISEIHQQEQIYRNTSYTTTEKQGKTQLEIIKLFSKWEDLAKPKSFKDLECYTDLHINLLENRAEKNYYRLKERRLTHFTREYQALEKHRDEELSKLRKSLFTKNMLCKAARVASFTVGTYALIKAGRKKCSI